jgi:hypothetical protein
MKLILKNGTTVPYKNGMGLTGLNIDSIVAESKEDRADLRMLLMGVLKVDESGCHHLARGFGSNALTQNPDVSNGSRALGVVLDSNQANHLDDKLKIIDALTLALNYGDNIGDVNRDLLSLKLKSVIDSL